MEELECVVNSACYFIFPILSQFFRPSTPDDLHIDLWNIYSILVKFEI